MFRMGLSDLGALLMVFFSVETNKGFIPTTGCLLIRSAGSFPKQAEIFFSWPVIFGVLHPVLDIS